ncbi:MAG: hypothetical protein WBF87_12795 [Mesorhizobium sp.]
MLVDPTRLEIVWRQSKIPVAWRTGEKGQPLHVKLPFMMDNRSWLRSMGRRHPDWIEGGKYWSIPKSWFNSLINKSLERFGRIYVIQPYREQEKCAPACMNAAGHECECSCMGANHGAGNDGSWFEVSETFATRWKDRELACRLMIAKER